MPHSIVCAIRTITDFVEGLQLVVQTVRWLAVCVQVAFVSSCWGSWVQSSNPNTVPRYNVNFIPQVMTSTWRSTCAEVLSHTRWPAGCRLWIWRRNTRVTTPASLRTNWGPNRLRLDSTSSPGMVSREPSTHQWRHHMTGKPFRITSPLWGESTSDWWIPFHKRPGKQDFCVFFVVSLATFWTNSQVASDFRHFNGRTRMNSLQHKDRLSMYIKISDGLTIVFSLKWESLCW